MTVPTKQPPPNPLYMREYVYSMSRGHAKIIIPAPGGKLPTGVEANEFIEFLHLIIRQIERARDAAELASDDQESVPISPHIAERVRQVLSERD